MLSEFDCVSDGNFEVLGAPVGSAEYCTAQTRVSGRKAESLLAAVGQLPHSGRLAIASSVRQLLQISLFIQDLGEFDLGLKSALEDIVGDELAERSWALAQLGIRSGGVGLRSAERHACAAYLASVSSCREPCFGIDHGFDPVDAMGGVGLRTADHDLRGRTLDAAVLSGGPLADCSQKRLSSLIDAAAKDRLLQPGSNDLSFRAHVQLCSMPGAGAWLTSPPADDGREIDSPLFPGCP